MIAQLHLNREGRQPGLVEDVCHGIIQDGSLDTAMRNASVAIKAGIHRELCDTFVACDNEL